MKAKIIIGADIVPTKSNEKYFENCDVDHLIGCDLKTDLTNADFIIMNLEVPLTDTTDPISKCGPNLIAGTKTIKGIHAINPYFFTLANNHILDQGEQGLYSTISLLDKLGIGYAGAGKNLNEASRPYIKIINGIKLGIYCCAEHEFTIASENSSGANPFDSLNSPDHITYLKEKCDYVIVLYHGGKEHYRYPSPNLQKIFRKLADKGADLIIAQHTHCIGCFEEYHNSVLIYGQGNFLFDHSDSDFWKTSLLIKLNLRKDDEKILSEIEYVPLKKTDEKVRKAEGADFHRIISEFEERSDEIKNKGIIEKKYCELADKMFGGYMACFSGDRMNFVLRVINKLSGNRFFKWYETKKYTEKTKIAFRNYIECEAHRELLLQGLKQKK